MSAEKKPELSYDQLSVWAIAAQGIDGMPEKTPEEVARKAAIKQNYYDHFNKVLQHNDLPALETTNERFSKPIHVIDYGSGLLRTLAGEAGLAASGHNNIPDASERMLRALNPLDRPALSTKEYMNLANVGDLGTLTDAEGNYPITGKQALGFAGDVALSPATIQMGLRSLLSGGAREAVPETAAAVRAAQELANASAKREMSPGMLDRAKEFLSNAGKLIDPLYNAGEATFRSRFKHADLAAQKAGKIPVSDIMLESGAKGGSPTAILQDMQAIASNTTDETERLLAENAHRGGATLDRVMQPLYSSEMAQALADPNQAKAALITIKKIEDDARAAIAQNPRTNDLGIGAAHMMSEDPTMQRIFRKQPNQQSLPLEQRTPYVATTESAHAIPPARELTDVGFSGQYGEPLPPIDIPKKDILDVAQPVYTLPQLLGVKRGYQNNAFQNGAYKAHNIADPVKAGEYDFGAQTYSDLADNTGRIIENELDKADSGIGGKVAKNNQKVASMLEGAQYLERPPKGIPNTQASTRAKRAFSVMGGAMGMAGDAVNSFKVPVGRALMSPWNRALTAPAARSAWLNNYWNTKDASNDHPTLGEDGFPGGDNPWGLIYKYGVKK